MVITGAWFMALFYPHYSLYIPASKVAILVYLLSHTVSLMESHVFDGKSLQELRQIHAPYQRGLVCKGNFPTHIVHIARFDGDRFI